MHHLCHKAWRWCTLDSRSIRQTMDGARRQICSSSASQHSFLGNFCYEICIWPVKLLPFIRNGYSSSSYYSWMDINYAVIHYGHINDNVCKSFFSAFLPLSLSCFYALQQAMAWLSWRALQLNLYAAMRSLLHSMHFRPRSLYCSGPTATNPSSREKESDRKK